MPAEWAAQGGRVYLVSGAWDGPQYQGSARLLLNGKVLHDFPGGKYQEFDVTRVLSEESNELLVGFKGDSQYQGIVGNVYLYHWAPPARRINLAGTWDARSAGDQPLVMTLPGEAKGWAPGRNVRIPAEWAGQYHVRLLLEGGPHDTAGVMVNGRLVRRHHHWFGNRADIDITRFLRFGEENRLELVHVYGGDRNPQQPPQWNLRTVELNLYPVDPRP